jgi:hypothetical protein
MPDSIKIDKLDDNFTIRIPSCLKDHLDKLPEENKQHMQREIRTVMAKAVHDSKFDPSLYLSSETSTNT